MKKTLLSLLILLVLLSPMALWANGQAGDEAGPTELRVAWWGNPTRDERTLGVIDLYLEQNADVAIEPETVGWGGYWDRINTQVASGTLPDVMQHDYAYLLQFVSRGQVSDMTPFVDSGVIDLSGVDESYLSGGRVDGKLYGISLGTNAVCLVYDPAVLQAAGVSAPGPDWTMEDYVDIALTVYEKTGVQTLPFFTTDPKVGYENWIRQTGQPMFASDGKSLGFTDPGPLTEYFEVQLELLEAGALIEAEKAFLSLSPQEGYLAKGESWVQFLWSNQFISTQEACNRPLEIALLPSIKDAVRPGTYLKPSMFFAIPSTSEEKEAAAEFVNFFLTDEGANDILMGERGVPIIPEIREMMKAQVTPEMQQVFDYITLVGDGNASPIDPPDPAATGEVLKVFRDITQEILTGGVSAAEGAEKIMSQANAILSR